MENECESNGRNLKRSDAGFRLNDNIKRDAEITMEGSSPALDGGWAWVVVFASFVLHILTRGILFSTGVLFSEWIVYFGKSKGETAWIGSIATGSALLLGPVTSRFIEIWGYRRVTMAGGCICTLGFLASYWANSVYFLYISYGAVAGSGLGISYLCAVVAVGGYFDKRRSLAFGIAASGAGFGTTVMAMLQRFLLNEYGWRGAMVVLAGVSGLHQILCGALMRPLSSSLNWRTNDRKVPTNPAIYEACQYAKSAAKENCETGRSRASRSSLHSVDSTSTPGTPGVYDQAGELREFKASTSDMDNAEKQQPVPTAHIPRERSYSGSHVPVDSFLSPVVMFRRNFNKGSANLINRNSFGDRIKVTKSMHSLFQGKPPSHTELESCESLLPGRGEKQSDERHVTSNQAMAGNRLRIGDALYLSSLSILSSNAVADTFFCEANTNHSNQADDAYGRDVQSSRTALHQQTESVPDLVCRTNPHRTQIPEALSNFKCEADVDENKKRKSIPLLRNPLFVMIFMNQFLTGLGVMVPFVHLTEKVILMGIRETKAAILISVIGIGNIVGKIILGLLCDMESSDVFLVFLLSQFGIALPVLLMPTFTSYASLIFFSFTFGFFYGNYAAIPSLVAEYVGLHNLAQGMGYINFLEGAAAIIGPPMAGLIYDVTENYNIAFVSAGCFLLISCLVLFLQPVYCKQITGKRSSLCKLLPRWRQKESTARRQNLYEQHAPMKRDINANTIQEPTIEITIADAH